MKSILSILFLLLATLQNHAQQAFTRISTDDGMGLSSNVVTSLYQDTKGFIWVGTANGLQRFDGRRFVQFTNKNAGFDEMPHVNVSQIVPLDSGKLLVAFESIREFGIFNPARLHYKKIEIRNLRNVHPRAEYRIWRTSNGDVYLNILKYGMLRLDKKLNAFMDDNPFKMPQGWQRSQFGYFEDVLMKRYIFSCDSGLCIYDLASKQLWYRNNNPKNIGLLKNTRVQDMVTEVYMDKQRRYWIFGWPSWGGGGQVKFCVDSNGNFLNKDTIGLNRGVVGYTEYRQFYETSKGALWIYGLGALFHRDTKKR